MAIAEIERQPVSDQVWNTAFFRLNESLEDYDAVLAEAVPRDIRNSVVEHRQARAYHEGSNATAQDDWPQYLKELQRRKEGGTRFPTGIPSLDEALGGGVYGTTMVVANKGMGKTSLLINTYLASLNADSSTAALFYFLDGRKAKVTDRMICKVNGIDIRQLECSPGFANSPASQRLRSEVLPRLKIIGRDFRYQSVGHEGTEFERPGLTHRNIVQDVQALRRTGAERVLIAIDLFQKMPVRSGTGASDRDAFRLDAIQEASQQLSRSLGDGNFAFFISSEIRKECNREPTMDDMKGDGRIASDADNVLAMWPRNSRASSSDVLELTLNIDKGRDGVVRGSMPIDFHHKVYLFSDPSTPSTGVSHAEQPSLGTTTPVDSLAE